MCCSSSRRRCPPTATCGSIAAGVPVKLLSPDGRPACAWTARDFGPSGVIGDPHQRHARAGRGDPRHAVRQLGPGASTDLFRMRWVVREEATWGRGHQQRPHRERLSRVPRLRRAPCSARTPLPFPSSTERSSHAQPSLSVAPLRRGRRAGRSPRRAQAQDKFTYMTNWYAQAEHGGFYQALANGHLQEARARRDHHAGRPAGQRHAAAGRRPGRLHHGLHDLHVMNGAEQRRAAGDGGGRLPEGPAGADRPPGRRQEPRRPEGQDDPDRRRRRTAYWLWLKAKYGFTDDQMRKYTFNIAALPRRQERRQQGYVTSEPYTIEKRPG